MKRCIGGITTCILTLSACLYIYIDRQNHITRLSLETPQLQKQVVSLEEENTLLKFEIAAFESPANLLSLARRHHLTYLKYAMQDEVSALSEGIALKLEDDKMQHITESFPSVVVGAAP